MGIFKSSLFIVIILAVLFSVSAKADDDWMHPMTTTDAGHKMSFDYTVLKKDNNTFLTDAAWFNLTFPGESCDNNDWDLILLEPLGTVTVLNLKQSALHICRFTAPLPQLTIRSDYGFIRSNFNRLDGTYHFMIRNRTTVSPGNEVTAHVITETFLEKTKGSGKNVFEIKLAI
ncbi:MAG: hypothetical protein WCG27_09620 [Pseudomonadota bacterium]